MKKGSKEEIEAMRSLIIKGSTYQNIADQYGITRQRVYQLVKRETSQLKNISMLSRCVYPNLAKKLSGMDIKVYELADLCGCNQATMTRYLKGFPMKQPVISKLMEITGLTYEEMFSNM